MAATDRGSVDWDWPGPNDAPGRVWTSRYQAREAIVTSGLVPVRITLGAPRFRLGYALGGTLMELAPGRAIFGLDHALFEPAFRAQLDTTGFPAIRERLAAISAEHDGRGLVLLCYEDLNQPGQWCHRQIVAAWLTEHGLGPVLELGQPRQPRQPRLL